jgi:DNA-binding transcriptional ArsR family regulator
MKLGCPFCQANTAYFIVKTPEFNGASVCCLRCGFAVSQRSEEPLLFMLYRAGMVLAEISRDVVKLKSEDEEKEGDVVYVTCDCGEEHRAVVAGRHAQLLKWLCPKEGVKQDVNA